MPIRLIKCAFVPGFCLADFLASPPLSIFAYLSVLVPFGCSLFNNFQHRVFFDFGGGSADKRPHGLGGAPLLSDHFADIFRITSLKRPGHKI